VIPLGEICRWVMTSDPTLHYALGGVRETMSTNGSGGTRMVRRGRRTLYRIVVRSELSERYAVAFEGMEMETKGGVTILTGKIIDQPHLHGIFDRINGLGLQLLNVEALPDDANIIPGVSNRGPKGSEL
jgi:hypothetical protein